MRDPRPRLRRILPRKGWPLKDSAFIAPQLWDGWTIMTPAQFDCLRRAAEGRATADEVAALLEAAHAIDRSLWETLPPYQQEALYYLSMTEWRMVRDVAPLLSETRRVSEALRFLVEKGLAEARPAGHGRGRYEWNEYRATRLGDRVAAAGVPNWQPADPDLVHRSVELSFGNPTAPPETLPSQGFVQAAVDQSAAKQDQEEWARLHQQAMAMTLQSLMERGLERRVT